MMTSEMEIKRQNLSEVFTTPDVLEVPFFQRAYVWEEDQLERLLEDVEGACSAKRPYFLGVLIFKQKGGTSFPRGNVRIVIDGQQRLTALSILCKVLCLRNNDLKKFDDTFRLKDKSIALRHNDYDRASYEKIMNLEQLEEIRDDSKLAKTYNYFRANIEPKKLDFDHICTSLNFAFVDVGENENKQETFDTINSLGVELTISELLKNYFFCRGETNRRDYEKYWKPVFEKDKNTLLYWNQNLPRNDSYTNINCLFFSYLQIKARERRPDDLNISETKTREKEFVKYLRTKNKELFDSYRRFIRKYITRDRSHILPVLEEIGEYSELFRNTIDRKKLDLPLPVHGIERINAIIFELRTTTLIPYILFVERNVENTKEKNAIYDYLEAYLVRRVLAGSNNSSYNKLFGGMLIWRRVLSYRLLQDYIKSLESELCMPTDDEVRKGFYKFHTVDLYQKIILYLLESKIRNQEYQSHQLLKISEYTLEHIMPKKWVKYWPHTDDPDRRDIKIRTYGNFAIVPSKLNSMLANLNWEEKKATLKSYSRDMKTLCGTLEKEQWDEDAIDERAEKLADFAIQTWPDFKPSPPLRRS